jgi:hypothetical protein
MDLRDANSVSLLDARRDPHALDLIAWTSYRLSLSSVLTASGGKRPLVPRFLQMGQHRSRNVGARRPVTAAPWTVRDVRVETGWVGLHRVSGVQEQQSGFPARHGGDKLVSGIESPAQAE